MTQPPFDKTAYQRQVNERMPKGRTLRMCCRAFWVGGAICCIGQLVSDFGKLVLHLSQENLASFTAIVMVFFGAAFTGIGVYDKLGAYAGAGSVVPITGFANSIVAPAIEFKTEGYVTGTAVKMFTIAGPVLVFGVSASIVAGLISLLFQ